MGISHRITREFLACESLEDRRLLTTLTSAALAALAGPPTADVSTAAGILESKAPQAFPAYQTALAEAEQSSKITPAQFNALASDEAALDAAINSAGFTASKAASQIGFVQDEIDGAFTGTVNRSDLTFYLQGTSASSQLINQTVSQMKLIARDADITSSVHASLDRNESAIARALGPKPSTDLGPGATDRDPLTVYDNAQVGKFIR